MIIWINGPFGVGKTTLAKSLTTQLKPSLICNPEYIGFVLGGSDDFQDIRLWRTLTGLTCGLLGRHFRRNLIVPMTVTNPAYLNEIFGLISARGVQLRHFYLDLDEDELRGRIDSDKSRVLRDHKVRDWRLSQLRRCVDAKWVMPNDTVFLRANRTVEQLTKEIQGSL